MRKTGTVVSLNGNPVEVRWLEGRIRRVEREQGQSRTGIFYGNLQERIRIHLQVDANCLDEHNPSDFSSKEIEFWSDAQKEALEGLDLSEGARVAIAIGKNMIPWAAKQL